MRAISPISRDSLYRALAEVVGEEDITADPIQLYSYSFDASAHHFVPDVVVRPESTEEVSRIVKLANELEVPVVPRGAATSLAGQATPILGGIVLDMVKMSRIKEVNLEDRYVVVEPGVVYDDLNAVLEPKGFVFPPAPASSRVCTLGGAVATNASGARAVKYGAVRDFVLGLEVVLPSGEIARFGGKCIKDSSGYQVARLFVGSEGTLGVITEITLRIVPKPKYAVTCAAAFASLEDAGKAVAAIMASGITPAALDLMDRYTLAAVRKAVAPELPEADALLIMEADGEPEIAKREIEEMARIAREHGAISLECSDDPKERERLWKARKSVLPVLSRYSETTVSVPLIDDLSVPPSKVPATIRAIEEASARYGVDIGTYGHIGDGNLHCKVLIDVEDPDQWNRAFMAAYDIYRAVVELGGLLSGEHGVGISKAPFALLQYGKPEIEAMRALKEALDPVGIMNPGKFPERIPKHFVFRLRYPYRGEGWA